MQVSDCRIQSVNGESGYERYFPWKWAQKDANKAEEDDEFVHLTVIPRRFFQVERTEGIEIVQTDFGGVNIKMLIKPFIPGERVMDMLGFNSDALELMTQTSDFIPESYWHYDLFEMIAGDLSEAFDTDEDLNGNLFLKLIAHYETPFFFGHSHQFSNTVRDILQILHVGHFFFKKVLIKDC